MTHHPLTPRQRDFIHGLAQGLTLSQIAARHYVCRSTVVLDLRAEARAAGLIDPRLYRLGFAHNNCGGACVKGGVAQWARLLEVFPERFAKVEAFEQRMRNKLGKDVSILRDRAGGETKPLTLAALRRRIEEQPDQLDLFDEGGCGCFTELAA